MKTKLASLLLTVFATTLLGQPVPQPPAAVAAPPTKGKSQAIGFPVVPLNPAPPSGQPTLGTNATRVMTVPGATDVVPLPGAVTNLPALPPPPAAQPSSRSLTLDPRTPSPFAGNTNRPSTANVLALPGNPGGALGTNAMGALANRAPTDLVLGAAGQQVLDPSLSSFKEMPLVQVLDIYAELTKRTILRSPTVPITATLTLVTKTPLTREETIQAIDSLLALNGIAIIPTGDKFLTVVPMQNALQEAARFNTNVVSELPEASQYMTKIIQVTNAKPSEIIAAIQPFAKMQGGILPIDATGVIVLRDNAINIKRMMEILEKIDVMLPSDEEFKVIPVNYALAADVAQVLGSFTTAGPSASGGTASRVGTTGSSTRRTGTTSPFGGNTGIPGVSGVQPGFGTQPGVNPGIPGAAQPGTQQAQFQNRLNQIVSNITGGRGGGAPLLGEARIIPYDRSNSLLVLANKSELAMLTRLLREIDVPQQQVLIEALIFETDLTHLRDVNFGVGQKTATAGANFFGKGGINSTFNFATNTGTALGTIGAATGGFAYAAQLGANWAAAIQMLESDSKTEVLSRPRIQTSHAEAATIFSGGTTPYVTGSISGGGFAGVQQQVQQLQIGINMSVLPLITSDGLVVLDINQTIEGESGTVKVGADFVPKTTRHTAQAKVAVKDGETIILGGLIRTAMTKSVSGVPVLKDIPGLGALFSSKSESPTRKELMVLIRPTVLKTPELASLAAQAERQRSPTLRGVEQTVRDQENKVNAKLLEEEKARAKKQEAEEIEKIRQELWKSRYGKPAQPDTSLAPVPDTAPAPAPATEQKPPVDFLDLPKP